MNAKMHRARLSVLFAAAALAVAACGGGDDDDAPAPGPAPTPTPTPTPPPSPQPNTLDKVKSKLEQQSSLWATAVPSAEQNFAHHDSCYLNNGLSKDMRIAGFNPDSAAYLVGFKVDNIEVRDERQTTNSDGSARHEVDVQYDEVYADGTANKGIRTTLISGSSAGTRGCATPTVSDEFRHMGNQRIAGFTMNPRNIIITRNKLSDGAAVDGATSIRREVRVNVTDPGRRATYAIVSGPGFASGKWKMLAAHVIRDAPEMQGKPGNAIYSDTDNFRICAVPSGSQYSSEAADCAGQGVGSDGSGVNVGGAFDPAAVQASDNLFNSWGFSTTAPYTVQLYNDDGWKTVNGQAGKTPIATYTTRLSALPYTLAQSVSHARTMSPTAASSSLSPTEIAAAMRGGGAATTVTLRNPQPLAGEPAMATSFVYGYVHGPKTGATGAWPRVRSIMVSYPAPGANTLSMAIPGKPEAASAVTYGELWFNGSDRNGRVVAHQMQFFD